MSVGDPIDDRSADAGDGPQPHANSRASDHQKPMLEDIENSLDLLFARAAAVVAGYGFSVDRHIRQFGKGEQAQCDGHHVEPVEQVHRIERPTQSPGLGIIAGGGHHETDASGGQPLDWRAPAQHRDKGKTQHHEGQHLRRLDVEQQGTQDRHAQRKQQRPEQAAEDRSGKGRAERPSGFAVARHGIAIEDRRRRSHGPRDAEQNSGNRVRCHHHRLETHQESQCRVGIHIESEWQKQRQPDQPAKAGYHAEHQADEHAQRQESQPRGIGHDFGGLYGHAKHVEFHIPPVPAISQGPSRRLRTGYQRFHKVK